MHVGYNYFQPISRYILEMVRDRPMFTMDCQSWVPARSVTFSTILTLKKVHFFLADLQTYACIVWPTTIRFGMVTHMGTAVFVRGQAQGAGPSAPKFLVSPSNANTVWLRTTEVLTHACAGGYGMV